MRICAAQTSPVMGDIAANIAHHKKFVNLALAYGADMIFFPELSLTGYEPELAAELATSSEDRRLDELQELSDNRKITIGAGLPIKGNDGTNIGMVVFQPNLPRQVYLKKYLHSDEVEFFTSGTNTSVVITHQPHIALAICYELSIPEHAADAHANRATIYVACAVKTREGVDRAIEALSGIAKKYSMTVLLSNCIGYSGGYDCKGNSSVWNNKGQLIGQLDDSSEGFVMIDTDTGDIIEKMFSGNLASATASNF